MNLILKILMIAFGAAAMLYMYLTVSVRKSVAAGQLDLGDDEIERLPDRIRLLRLDGAAARVPESMALMARQLFAEGFEDAGTHEIEGVPGAIVRLLAHRAQSMYCAIWAHSTGGSWFEFSCNYRGGATTTFTTLAGSGFDGRPGQTIVRSPGCGLHDLYVRACRERPTGEFLPANVEQSVAEFESGYSQWMTWQRARGHGRRARAA